MLPKEPARTTSGGSALCRGGDPILVHDAPTATSPNRPLAEIASTEPTSPAGAGAPPVLPALPGVVVRCTEMRLGSTLRLMLRQFKHVPPHWEQPRTGVLSCPTLCAPASRTGAMRACWLHCHPWRIRGTERSDFAFRGGSLHRCHRIRGSRAALSLWAWTASLLRLSSEEFRVRGFAACGRWRWVAQLPPSGSEEPSDCAFAACLRRLRRGLGIRGSRALALPLHH